MIRTRKQQGNTTLLLIAVIALLSIGSGWLVNQWLEQKKQINHLEALRNIKSLDGILRDAMTFEFARISTQFVAEINKIYERPKAGGGLLDDKVHILYSKDYNFTFGYDLENWNWCPDIIDQENGIVSVHAPAVIWTNEQKQVTPDTWIVLDGVFYTALEDDVQRDAKSLISEKIAEKANDYLKDEKLQLTVKRALSQFLMQTMNDAHEGNPISEVRLVSSSACNASPVAPEGSLSATAD